MRHIIACLSLHACMMNPRPRRRISRIYVTLLTRSIIFWPARLVSQTNSLLLIHFGLHPLQSKSVHRTSNQVSFLRPFSIIRGHDLLLDKISCWFSRFQPLHFSTVVAGKYVVCISNPCAKTELFIVISNSRYFSQICSAEISNLIHQADKMSPSEMRGAAQSSMGIGGLGAREPQGLGGAIGGLGGLEGAQQLGGQSQGTSLESASMAGSERLGGVMETGVSPGALGQTGLGESAGLSESAVSRMTDGSLGGRTGESPQGIQGMQSIQDIQGMQGMQGMQSMSSALTGGQSQGGILSEGGGMSALQGQGMMGAGFQGGLQGMMGGGGGLAGLQSMGTGADLGQQQMSFKKVS